MRGRIRVVDKGSGGPIALVITGNGREEAKARKGLARFPKRLEISLL